MNAYSLYFQKGKVLGWGVFVVMILASLWMLAEAFVVSKETGILNIKSANPKAGLIISQDNRQAKFIGTGSAKIRLKAGSYQLQATYNGDQSSTLTEVHNKTTTNASLGAVKSVTLPSVEAINFENTNALIGSGLTTDQVNALEQHFFQYKPRAKIIKIDSTSVKPGPYNPNTSTSFTMDFSVSIDGETYKAIGTYYELDYIELSLYNSQTNSLVFNSSSLAGE